MVADIPRNTPVVHLALDIQEEYLSRLEKTRTARLPVDVRKFADDLTKKGIPTIWVAYGDDVDEFVTRGVPDDPTRYGLPTFVHDSESIFIKSSNNAFYKPVMAEYLKACGTHSVVVSGLNTRRCIADTIWGGQMEQFKCHAVFNLMGDVHAEVRQDASPSWHRQELEAKLEQYRTGLEYHHGPLAIVNPQVSFCTADDFLASLARIEPPIAAHDRTPLRHLQKGNFARHLEELRSVPVVPQAKTNPHRCGSQSHPAP